MLQSLKTLGLGVDNNSWVTVNNNDSEEKVGGCHAVRREKLLSLLTSPDLHTCST